MVGGAVLENEEALPGEGVVGMGHEIAAKALGKAGGAHRVLHHRLERREGIEHRGHEHVPREPAHGVELDVHQARTRAA